MKWITICLPIVLLIDIIVLLNFVNYQRDTYADVRQRQLDMQVNYSLDAAGIDMLTLGTHIDTDYADWGAMSVEPDIAYYTYTEVLLRNLGYRSSKKGLDEIETMSIPFFAVAAYDGYYVYYKQPTLTTVGTTQSLTRDMLCTPKIPYAEYRDGKYKFYNLGDSYYGVVNNGSVTKSVPYANQIEIDNKKTCITKSIESSINSALYVGMNGTVQKDLIIPERFTQWSQNNTIDKVTLLTYLEDPVPIAGYELCSFGISGVKIDEPDFCILYEYGGSKLYTRIVNRPSIEAQGIAIIEVVESPKIAASLGYYVDTRY